MYEIKTRKEYDFYECSSAFQKAIRRNEIDTALFFGFELYASGYSKYCWKRLMIITSEDIGLGVPDAINTIMNLHKAFEIIFESNIEEASMPFFQAIVYLCELPKSRAIDEYKMFLLKSDQRLEIPDYALDVHTRRGKALGKDHKTFLSEGRITNPTSEYKAPENVSNFYIKYLTAYADKKISERGYDDKNVTHKSIKDMDQWKKENQPKLF